jgi:hypothetical protein
MIRDVAEGKGGWNLQEQADRGKSIAGKLTEAEAIDQRRSISIKGSLRSIVGQGNQDMDIEPPVLEL